MQTRRAIVVLIFLTAACRAAPASSRPEASPAAATASEVTGIVPKNAIVTLLPASGAPPLPAEPAVLDQISKQFLPRTLLVRVGQPVEFRNSEDMPHNVSVTRRGAAARCSTSAPIRIRKYNHTFDRVGQFDVTCDIHKAWRRP